MKLLKDSGKKHWAIGQIIDCALCESQFSPETEDDYKFLSASTKTYKVQVTCPNCGYIFTFEKPVKLNLKWPNPLPSVEKGGTWKPPQEPMKITFTNRAPLSPKSVVALEDAARIASNLVRHARGTGVGESVSYNRSQARGPTE